MYERVFTERAHLMCPRMCFGIAVSVNSSFDETRIKDCLRVLANAHPFLKALLGYAQDRNDFYYQITEIPQVVPECRTNVIEDLHDPALMKAYTEITGCEWDLTKEGMLKVIAWRMKNRTCFLLVFHHLLADGRGALMLSEELADLYAFAAKPACVPEKLISSIADFPADSRLPLISRLLVKRANKEWVRENQSLSYKAYLELAGRFFAKDRIDYDLTETNGSTLHDIVLTCQENAVTVNDYLLAEMFIQEKAKKIIVACDLRERMKCYRHGALGNYSTAFSIAFRKTEKELLPMAGEVHRQVQRVMHRPSALYLVLQCYAEMTPGLLDAAFAAAKGLLESKAATFIGTNFFGFAASKGYSLTNLGKIESRSIDSALFIPPCSPAVHMIRGVVTVNDRMMICTARRS